MLLAEDHILLGTDQRSPRAHAPLQRTPNAGADLGMAPPDFFEHRNRPNAGGRLQDRHNLAVPNLGQWIRPPSATRRFLLRGQPRIILNPVAGCRAEAGLGGSNGGIVGLSVTHVQPHLMVGDVEAGQCLIPQRSETNQKLDPVAHDRQTGSEKPAAGAGLPSVGLRPPSVSPPPAHSHPD